MEGKNIVIVGQQPWDIDIGSNAKNIALEFAKKNKVLYVNAPLDRRTKMKKGDDPKVMKRLDVYNGKVTGLEQLGDNLWNLYPKMIAESVNWIRIHSLFKFFNKRNNKRFAQAILWAIRELKFDTFYLFNDSLMFRGFYLKEFLKPEKYIYYTRDYLIIQPYFKRHGRKLEGKLMKKSDLVVANSTFLQEYAAKFNKAAYYVGQGCEVARFDAAKVEFIPHDLPTVVRPIVGYVGYLTSMRLDIELLIYLAKSKPNIDIILVGPEDEAFENSELHSFTNVYFLGPKPPKHLPGYIKQFDVCINPQIVNMLTIGNYPRKIDEYLAMAKPVVATKTKAMEVFADHVYLSENFEEFAENVAKALKEKNEELANSRKTFAQSHTWENSVKEIYKAIEIAS